MLVMYPVGYIIMLNGSLRESYLYTSSFYLFVQSLVTFLIVAELASVSKAFSASFVIMILSLTIEGIGVNTGLPFGNYTYTKVLSIILPGNVPIAIAFAWMTLSINSFLIIKYFLKNRNPFFAIFLSGVLIAFIDVLLEPFASYVNNYWVWSNGIIPLRNYLSWFVIGVIFSYILERSIGKNVQIVKIRYPLIILTLSILQFILINLLNHYYINSVIGISGIFIVLLSIFILSKNEK